MHPRDSPRRCIRRQRRGCPTTAPSGMEWAPDRAGSPAHPARGNRIDNYLYEYSARSLSLRFCLVFRMIDYRVSSVVTLVLRITFDASSLTRRRAVPGLLFTTETRRRRE